MRDRVVRPFESIESALEFMALLEGVIHDASSELRGELSSAETERYKNGLNLALYKIEQLAGHVQKSRRLLNDLSLIRGVLTAEGVTRNERAAAVGR